MEKQMPITTKEINDFIVKFKVSIKGLPLIAYIKKQEAVNNEFEEALKIVQDKVQDKAQQRERANVNTNEILRGHGKSN